MGQPKSMGGGCLKHPHDLLFFLVDLQNKHMRVSIKLSWHLHQTNLSITFQFSLRQILKIKTESAYFDILGYCNIGYIQYCTILQYNITVAFNSLMTNIEAAPQGFPCCSYCWYLRAHQAEWSLAAPQCPFILWEVDMTLPPSHALFAPLVPFHASHLWEAFSCLAVLFLGTCLKLL